MSNNYNITIAIPVYNKEKYIKRCINSALKQKGADIKILVVDNLSTDNSWQIIQTFGNKIESVRNKKNLGMAGNWNKCIKLCTSKLIMILHADDILEKDIIEHYIDFFKNNKSIGLVHADGKAIGTKGHKKNNAEIIKKGKNALDRILGNPDIICSSVVLKTSVFKKVGYFIEKSLSSDVEMRGRIACQYNIGYLNKFTVLINKNNDSTGYYSLINRNINEIINDWENLTNKIISYYKKNEMKNVKYLKNKFMISWILGIIHAGKHNKQYKKIILSYFYILFRYNGLFTILKYFLLKKLGKS